MHNQIPVSYTHLDVYKRQHHFRLFLQIYIRKMEQTPSISPLILTIPWELITIMSFKGQNFELALAMTCLLYTSRCV